MQEAIKQVAYYLQQEDPNGAYIENLEEDLQNPEETAQYYISILEDWKAEATKESEIEKLNDMIDSLQLKNWDTLWNQLQEMDNCEKLTTLHYLFGALEHVNKAETYISMENAIKHGKKFK